MLIFKDYLSIITFLYNQLKLAFNPFSKMVESLPIMIKSQRLHGENGTIYFENLYCNDGLVKFIFYDQIIFNFIGS